MKYMIEWSQRYTGDLEDDIENFAMLLKGFSTWAPPEGVEILAYVGRADNNNGYLLVDTDDFANVAAITSQFTFFVDHEVHPVLDIADAAGIAAGGLDWIRGVVGDS